MDFGDGSVLGCQKVAHQSSTKFPVLPPKWLLLEKRFFGGFRQLFFTIVSQSPSGLVDLMSHPYTSDAQKPTNHVVFIGVFFWIIFFHEEKNHPISLASIWVDLNLGGSLPDSIRYGHFQNPLMLVSLNLRAHPFESSRTCFDFHKVFHDITFGKTKPRNKCRFFLVKWQDGYIPSHDFLRVVSNWV